MPISDGSAAVTVIARVPLYKGFRQYDAVTFADAGGRTRRELLSVGRVAAVLPYDPIADAVVLLRQFRLGAHEATGLGDMIEIVAGLVGDDEDPIGAALRETLEEIGAPTSCLWPCFDFLPSPGFSDEHAHLYCGRVDASKISETAGLAGEGETTRPFVLPATEAIKLASRPEGIRNGFTRLALLWFASNRAKVRRAWRSKTDRP